MKALQPLTNDIKAKIKTYIKNNIDISDLIDGYCIAGMDLSGARITRLNKIDENISNVNFSQCTIGLPGSICNISGSKLVNCNFKAVKLQGVLYARKCDFRGTNFSEADMVNVEYQYSDLRGCKFCETALRIGSRLGVGARFDENLFKELARHWNLDITITPKSKE